MRTFTGSKKFLPQDTGSMKIQKQIRIAVLMLVFITFGTGLNPASVFGQAQLTFEDVMQFETISSPEISANGEWVVYEVWPEVGDGEVRIRETEGDTFHVIERGKSPALTSNGSWVGALIHLPAVDLENMDSDDHYTDLLLMDLSSGDTLQFGKVNRFEFSNDGKWLVIHHDNSEEIEELDSSNSYLGSPVRIVSLENRSDQLVPFVHEISVDSTSAFAAVSIVDTSGTGNALRVISLEMNSDEEQMVASGHNHLYSNLTWDTGPLRLAFTRAVLDTAMDYRASDASILSWQQGEEEPSVWIEPENVNEGYRLRPDNKLLWTHDGTRLYYGVKLDEMVQLDEQKENEDSVTTENLYSVNRILNGVESDVWHTDDPRIKTHEKQTFDDRKNHLYRAVYHIVEDRSVQLATKVLSDVNVEHHTGKLLASTPDPYLKLITWDGWYRDVYLVDPQTGDSEKVIEKQRFDAELSPDGRYLVWFDGADWNRRDTETGEVQNLTSGIDVPFADVYNDRPMPSSSYGIGGWTEESESVFIYDQYDIWQVSLSDGKAINITGGEGRNSERIFRIYDLDRIKETFEQGERLLLTMYHDKLKNDGFYEARVGRSGVKQLLEEDKKFTIRSVADESGAILYTRESYTEYPNLWVAKDHRFQKPEKVSHLHEDLTERYAWGRAELVEWLSLDGEPVQGILYYPGNYEPDKRYPVFIYYYERFSQRLYDFNEPYTNHRPNIAQYTSDGYVVFLPDIWFDVPVPGYSATKHLVPGVQKLVEMGVADPDAIGLHGHSWSGYMTAHVITQTDIFAAAIAGAPVSNMTSAYGGIRWGSGLARQFQYEQTQSRLGVSLWENRAPYIENSPLFYADRIQTPILFQHGDADEAVPWYQSIELYLALRRLDKEAVFLQYHDEPHHLRKLANRLDYAMKMKEYMDHYLKGEAAPEWIEKGVPYKGE